MARQSNNTSNTIFNVADSISCIGHGMTLESGDPAWPPRTGHQSGSVTAMPWKSTSKKSESCVTR
jgi:hypothetical protein